MTADNTPARPQPPVYQDARIKRHPPGHDILTTLNNLGMLFAKRPLALGESEQDYDDFLRKVSITVQPGDIIETLWVKDIVDLRWETMRLRRAQASLLMSAARVVLANLLRIEDAGLIDGIRVFTLPDLLKGFADGDDQAVAEVGRVLARRGTDWDMIMAQALVDKLNEIGAIERMIAGADARRSKVLQEIDRRRDAFARRLRAAGAVTPHGDIRSPG
ncbi:hypothetical protein [Microvirga aerophila]|uniref:Uncharacterized protein n=1 Tax=Microvirga aerophila TaxID=670291 RepID=A0A512BRV6_9HYPH|nr:hypothetical protein [Microvirga aerophila]GEO14645.1 hypothetical protein MAE02_23410 [Microvirga aerophila]